MKNKYYINSRLFQPSGCLTSEAIGQYLRGELSGEEKHMVEQHLEECPLCSDASEGLNMLGEQQRKAAVSDITRNIARETGSKGTAQPVLHRRNNVYKYVAAVAALVILIGSVYWYHSGVGENARFIAATEEEDIREERIERKSEQEKQVEKEKPIVPSAPAQQEEINIKEQRHQISSESARKTQPGVAKEAEQEQNVNSVPVQQDEDNKVLGKEKVVPTETEKLNSLRESKNTEDDLSKQMNQVQLSSPGEQGTTIADEESTDEDAGMAMSALDSETDEVNRQSPSTKSKKANEIEIIEEEPVYDRVYIIVEEMPEFKGEGKEAFRQYIAEHLQYPQKAQKKGIEGKVYVQFIVTKNGTVDDVKVIRGVHPLLDKEAVRVIKSSPDWEPGKQRGEPVNVKFTLPISFSLKK